MFPNSLALNMDLLGNDLSRNPMHQMDQMMNSVFGGFPNPMASMPFGGGMFGNFGSMLGGPMMMNHMSSMNDHMKNQMQMMVGGASGPNHSFSSSSSTFMSYSSNGPNGQPQVYKASTSTRIGPGGVKETKKAVSDSRTGVKKMAIGHHIGDRAHIVERQQNLYSGEREENQEYINLDDDETEDFNNEWRQKAQHMNSHRNRYLPYTHRVKNSSTQPPNTHLKALPSSTSHNSDALAIEAPPQLHEQPGRKRLSKQRTPKKIYKSPDA